LRQDIKLLASYYVDKFGTRNPYELARCLNVELQIGDMGAKCGCYMFLKKHRCIFLNQNLSGSEMLLVLAHELGHAVLHRTQNCYFIKNKTLLSSDKFELEANVFAAELLINDDMIDEYSNCTIEQFSKCVGIAEELVRLRLKNQNSNFFCF